MKKFIYLLYFFIASSVAIAISCSVFYLSSLSEIDLYSRLSIHTHAQKIRFLRDEDGLSALHQLYSNRLPFTVLMEKDINPYQIGVLFYGKQDAMDTMSSTITEGRFFLEEDFFAGHHYAVVGKNLSSQVYFASGNQWIAIDGIPFRVIGILDTGTNSPIDQCIYYNLDALSSPDLCYMDGNSTQQIEQSLSSLDQYAYFQKLDAPKRGVSRLMDLAFTEKLFLFLILCSVIIFHYYSIRLIAFVCGELVGVRCLLGYSFQKASSQVMGYIFVVLSTISILICIFNDVLIVPRFHFGNIPFPMIPSLLTLELGFALPSAVYGKLYFLKTLKRRLGCP